MTTACLATIVFETHATSLDNEAGFASGHCDVDLSPLGVEQARELGARHPDGSLDLVVASDLLRARRTAAIAFGDRVPLEIDARLRECDYGHLTRHPVAEIDAWRSRAVMRPFPGGESYQAATERVRRCLDDLYRRQPGARVLLVGHRATLMALEHLLRPMPLADAVAAPWQWQPGWEYAISDEVVSRLFAGAAEARSREASVQPSPETTSSTVSMSPGLT